MRKKYRLVCFLLASEHVLRNTLNHTLFSIRLMLVASKITQTDNCFKTIFPQMFVNFLETIHHVYRTFYVNFFSLSFSLLFTHAEFQTNSLWRINLHSPFELNPKFVLLFIECLRSITIIASTFIPNGKSVNPILMWICLVLAKLHLNDISNIEIYISRTFSTVNDYEPNNILVLWIIFVKICELENQLQYKYILLTECITIIYIR